ncbi:SusC/RagA family TonB-linked outer membrane protein [Fulvivirga ligni]|uniref:SusC/RagA family TonB-linked outer membrane protein n=1 Tax=Fulvivirga ligni TaxID=2904246 RepID=UPI001F19D19D|nr:SusC/RagA family TonB-linked outer membrane protein [Fulvivirga ligni]UII20856.1 SusC/RagA family TonB-linked outer membrane protein [Fulvivirga ligni]
MKTFLPLIILIWCSHWLYAQSPSSITFAGRVIAAADSLPLPGASVTIKGSIRGTITDSEGTFTLSVPVGSTVVFSYIGYQSREHLISNPTSNFTIALTEDYMTLGEVEIYSTGYEEIPVELATGSYEQINQQLLNRGVGTDVVSRLEGITSGLLFDRRLVGAGSAYGNDYRNLRIRGVSSISSETQPLIVVDNFPYEGDINSINPNDIESITVLKDAAAASIWGAQAANGVIVITTNKGGYEQPLQVQFSAQARMSPAPDLYANPNYLPSEAFISVEQSLFDQGYYDSDAASSYQPLLSPAVEIRLAQREGSISSQEAEGQLNQLRQQDVRQDMKELFYQNSLSQQYAINLQGGHAKASYYLSGGYDAVQANTIGNDMERFTLTARNTFRPIKPLQIQTGIYLSRQSQENNAMPWGTYASRYPYNQLINAAGEPLPVGKDYRLPYVASAEDSSLLNWQYYPVEEQRLMDNSSHQLQQRLNLSVQYEFLPETRLTLSYQYQQQQGGDTRELISEDSYYVRNLINRFTDESGSHFPAGDILQLSHQQLQSQVGRLQMNTHRGFGDGHEITALAGAEVREVHGQGSSYEYLGYDDDVLTTTSNIDYLTYFNTLPAGRARISPPSTSLSDETDRYISYYGNAAYTLRQRYTVSGSARWDASNLFGVKTNQKGVPLWSAGLAWTMSKENFYQLPWLSYLRLRATYGYNGNINKQATAFVTSQYLSPYLTNFQVAEVQSPGNPQLRWEKVGVVNVGLDFKAFENRLSGGFEYYHKKGEDLLGRQALDPTTGFSLQQDAGYLANYANTGTNGWDLNLNSLNINRQISWQTNIILSHAVTRLTSFDDEANNASIYAYFNNSTLKLKEDSNIDALYALPWHGLDPNTGAPIVMVDGQESTDYATYFQDLTFEDLKEVGLTVPSYFGAVRNTLRWKNLSLSANITFKLNYVFRRNSIDYQSLFSQSQGHIDYLERWQQPGDEQHTNVPSMPSVAESSSYRDYAYLYSEKLVEKGDHIRLQDIRAAYTFQSGNKSWFKSLECYLYASNLGFIWRANNLGLDPDYPSAQILPTPVYAIGTSITF